MKRLFTLTGRLIALGIVLILFISVAHAQNVNIKGMVSDSTTNEPLYSVNIVQKGTINGVVSDFDGNFSLSVPRGSIVVFSYIGYQTREIQVNENNSNLKIRLQSSARVLDDLIVIGYSVQKKTDKTGAVSNVQATELVGGTVTDPVQGLQGKAAGVSVTKKGGDPNAGFSIQIRGASGFNSNTQPLYVIDGVPGADPTAISPADIESINILKDAASTAIYGSRGSNGVIIITTKKGVPGSSNVPGGNTRVSIGSQVSFDQVARKLDILDAQGMRDFANILLQEALPANPNYTVDSVFTDGGASTDWQDEIYRTGISTSTNISLSGGNQHSSYFTSVTHANWEGIMLGTAKQRTTARVNVTHNALDDKLRLSGNLMTSFENNDYEDYGGWGKSDIIYQAISRNPTDPVLNDDGSYYQTSRVFNYENPLAIINEITNNRDAKRMLGNFRADYTFMPGLVGSVNTGYMRNDHTSNYFRPANLYASADNGFSKKSYENSTQKLIEITANYNKVLKEVHNLDVLAGYSWQESVYSGFYAQGGDAQSEYAGPDNLAVMNDVKWGDIGSWKGQWNLIGFFGRFQYNYNGKYYLTGSIRRDGSSKFGINNKWGWFPTVAAGWTLTEEPFMKGWENLDQLKLRASWGIAGNQEIGEYRSMVVWEPSGKAINPETGQEVITFRPAWNANPDLKWEETSEFNVGIDFAFGNYKYSGSLEAYHKKTSDLLGEYNVPVPPNLASKTFANSGSLSNTGVELYLQAFLIDKKNLLWKSSITMAHNTSKIIDLGEYFNEEDGVRKEGFISGRGMVGEEYYVTGILVGEKIGAFYLPVYVTMQGGEFIYKSINGGFTDNLSEAKREIVGCAAPILEVGWSNSLTIKKNWMLDFSFRSMIGNKVYNATAMFFDNPGNLPSLNALPEALDWREEGRTSGSKIADFYVEDASFLKLDYIALSYKLPRAKLGKFHDISISLSASNLFTLTGYSGIDPETSISGLSFGIDQYNVYPKTRSVSMGIKADF
jgi:TonB-dependent starch-binding outer membrane protein SusC